jgi:hypothetical protein
MRPEFGVDFEFIFDRTTLHEFEQMFVLEEILTNCSGAYELRR